MPPCTGARAPQSRFPQLGSDAFGEGKGELKDYLERVRKARPSEYHALMCDMDENVAEVQEDTLLAIVGRAKDTEFGRAYGFADIHGVEDYRKRVPVTEFDDYRDAIERMKRGEENILFPGKAVFFAVTSGTTGHAKFIPESATGELVKDLVVQMRKMERERILEEEAPETRFPGARAFIIANSATYTKTEGGIPAGAASGRTAASAGKKSTLLAVPPELFGATDISTESMNYVNLLFTVASRDVVGTILNNVAHFHTLWDQFASDPEPFLTDIQNGTISVELSDRDRSFAMAAWKADPKRAAELRGILRERGSLNVVDVWQRFRYVGCWLSGSVGRFAEEFSYLFPEDTLYLDWGYGASEGKLNIPFISGSPAGFPVSFGYFLEFLEIGKTTPLLLSETKAGMRYEIILTSYSGFYRYNLHDIVEIGMNADGLRTVHFVCKATDQVTIDGHTLYSGDVIDMVRAYEKDHPETFFHIFRGKAVDDGLVMYVEPTGAYDESQFVSFARERLQELGISLKRVERLDQGAGDKAMVVKDAERVKTVNTTKVQIFIR